VRYGGRAPSVTSSRGSAGNDKRLSVASSKALSSKTCVADDASIKGSDYK
jgi:hypothetical protein